MSGNSGFNENYELQVTVGDLPMTFKVKYIGCEIARGLWGIKYTRRPVDIMVGIAKTLPPNKQLPQCNLTVSIDGVKIDMNTPKITSSLSSDSATLTPATIKNIWNYPIDTISYGVQDLVYTRVFAMIVVKDDKQHPFEVHAFVCDSRAMARKLTFALAAAFQDYSRRIKESTSNNNNYNNNSTSISSNSECQFKKKFAIDLRTPEEQQECENDETEA